MRWSSENLAVGAVLATLAAAVALPLLVEASRREARAVENPTIELTGMMGQGVWTDEAVPAATSWRRSFRRARPVLELGQAVQLRLTSADVVHSFAVPGLGIEPVEVIPGRIVEIQLTPREPGVFEYYCTTVCGEPHFAMRGVIEVLAADGSRAASIPQRPGAGYWRTPEPPAGATSVERGAWLYRRQGCVACHGETGAGGVANPGSMNAVVPVLAELSRRTFLFAAADIDAFLEVLGDREVFEAVVEAPDVPLFPLVKTQFLKTRELVREGRRSARLDPASPRPPLEMPAWGARLSDDEIDAILAYLLTLGRREGADASVAPAPTSPKGDPR